MAQVVAIQVRKTRTFLSYKANTVTTGDLAPQRVWHLQLRYWQKYCLQNGDHFVQRSLYQPLVPTYLLRPRRVRDHDHKVLILEVYSDARALVVTRAVHDNRATGKSTCRPLHVNYLNIEDLVDDKPVNLLKTKYCQYHIIIFTSIVLNIKMWFVSVTSVLFFKSNKCFNWLPCQLSNTPIPHIRSSYRSEPFWANLRTAVSTDQTLGERPFFALLHSNNNLLTTVTIPQGSSTVQAPTM